MQIDSQYALEMAEKSGRLAFIDLEATGLHGDYNSILVGSVKPYGRKTRSFVAETPGDDLLAVQDIRDELEKYYVWVSYYGKEYDIKLIKSRLLHYAARNLDPRHHVDLYFHLKYHLLTSRKSQAHLLEWLNTKQRKMTLSPDEWNRVLREPDRGLEVLRKRCESDVRGLEALYKKTRHLIVNVTR